MHLLLQEHGRARSPYYVSFFIFLLSFKLKLLSQTQGFYREGKPVLSTFLHINVTLEISASSQQSAAPVIMIHLVLVDFKASGSPFTFAYEYLSLTLPMEDRILTNQL